MFILFFQSCNTHYPVYLCTSLLHSHAVMLRAKTDIAFSQGHLICVWVRMCEAFLICLFSRLADGYFSTNLCTYWCPTVDVLFLGSSMLFISNLLVQYDGPLIHAERSCISTLIAWLVLNFMLLWHNTKHLYFWFETMRTSYFKFDSHSVLSMMSSLNCFVEGILS